MSFVKPSKVISGELISISSPVMWPHDNGDAYWSGGASPKAYQWNMTIAITASTHSNPKTRSPYQYTGIDVRVGDYLSDTNGRVLKIIAVNMKTDLEIRVSVEDVNRVNMFSDVSRMGNGAFNIGAALVIFELSSDGNPILNPFPEIMNPTSYANIVGRFDRDNPSYFYQLENTGAANLKPGMFMSVRDGEFVQVSSENNLVLGKVTEVNAAANLVAFSPLTKIVDNYDSLPGEVGDLLYSVEGTDGLHLSGDVPVLVKLRGESQTKVTGSLYGPTEPNGKISLNGVMLTVGGEGTTLDLVDAINQTTDQHSITATTLTKTITEGGGGGDTIAKTNFAHTEYGEPAGFISGGTLSASINGVVVNFTTTTDGLAALGEPVCMGTDMVVDINNAQIPNVVASNASGITLTNSTGGDIIIVNLGTDDNGLNFAGPGSCSGLPLETIGLGAAELITINYPVLTAPDARAISFPSVPGSNVLSDFGLFDVENGDKAIGVMIGGSSGMRTASTAVVPNIAARELLDSTVGDQAMVLDKGDGEWGLYLHDGSDWRLISSQESSVVDARSVSITVTAESQLSGVVCEVSGDSQINSITIEVVSAFAEDAFITVGDSTNPALLLVDHGSDLSTVGKYVVTPSVSFDHTGDVPISYFLNPGSGSGELLLTVTYS